MANKVSIPDENQGPLLNRVSVAIYSLALVFIGLRFITRGLIVRKYGLDDCFIAIAITLAAVQTSTIVLQVKYGLGRPVEDLKAENYYLIIKYKWVNMMVYYVANWSVKMSILALYHRIGAGRKGLPWVLRPRVVGVMVGVVTAFTIAVFFTELCTCQPMSETWEVESDIRTCVDVRAFHVAQGSINVLVDVLLLIFPLPLLRVLNIDRKQKAALVMILSIGLIPLVASVIRVAEIVMVSRMKDLPHLANDPGWRWAWVPVWGQIEVSVGIVAASLPSLSPLLKKFWCEVSTQILTTGRQTPSIMEPSESIAREIPSTRYSAFTLGDLPTGKNERESFQSDNSDTCMDLEAQIPSIVEPLESKISIVEPPDSNTLKAPSTHSAQTPGNLEDDISDWGSIHSDDLGSFLDLEAFPCTPSMASTGKIWMEPPTGEASSVDVSKNHVEP